MKKKKNNNHKLKIVREYTSDNKLASPYAKLFNYFCLTGQDFVRLTLNVCKL